MVNDKDIKLKEEIKTIWIRNYKKIHWNGYNRERVYD